MQNQRLIFILFLIVSLTSSCGEDDIVVNDPIELPVPEDPFASLNLPEIPYDYENIQLPSHYLVNDFQTNMPFQFAAIESDNTPIDNPITNEAVRLGRVIFYEKNLSANGMISCASCHEQQFGFSDEIDFSIGVGGLTRRHSMSLTNARFYDTGKFFSDERSMTLEDLVLLPFQDPIEMGLTLDQVIQIIREQSYAASLFTDAFGDESITADRIAKSLSQFIRSIVSFNSKYDQGRSMVNSPEVDFPNFTAEENLGKELFFAPSTMPSCSSCHMSEAFILPLLASNETTIGTNNGIDVISTDDFGIYESSGIDEDRGKFKVASLKNIAITSPYMHDGRFTTLEEVIDHYSTGIKDHPNLEPVLRASNGDPIQFNFTQEEKDALIAFLHTLTDDEFLVDPKFSDPFK